MEGSESRDKMGVKDLAQGPKSETTLLTLGSELATFHSQAQAPKARSHTPLWNVAYFMAEGNVVRSQLHPQPLGGTDELEEAPRGQIPPSSWELVDSN